jgi:hypothetical protein
MFITNKERENILHCPQHVGVFKLCYKAWHALKYYVQLKERQTPFTILHFQENACAEQFTFECDYKVTLLLFR